MCLGMNPDILSPASAAPPPPIATSRAAKAAVDAPISSRPEMAAAAAIAGHFVDVRNWTAIERARSTQPWPQRRRQLIMEPFKTITSLAAPLDRVNVDTDQIIPKQFLKRIERSGYGEFLFFDWRRLQEGPNTGDPDPSFVSTTQGTTARKSSSPAKTSAAAPAANTPPGHSATTASAQSSPPPSPTSSSQTPAKTA